MPLTPPLEVHLYWLQTSPLLRGGLSLAWLTAEERARHDRWLSDEKRFEFLAGRALLRHVLRAHAIPEAAFRVTASGRPELRGGADINLSHSSGHFLVGFTPRGRVGVDVEVHAPRERTLMDRFFNPDEQRWMGDSPGRLHELWTLKEAAMKAVGTGVSGNPARVTRDPVTGAVTIDGTPPGVMTASWQQFGEDVSAAAVWLGLLPAVDTFQLHHVTARELLDEQETAAQQMQRNPA
ncbi:MAG: 4'-phosphopantetheinyl transferase superfamily protein [Myxococcota bacterium]